MFLQATSARPYAKGFEGCVPRLACGPQAALAYREAYVDLGVSTTAQGAAGGGNVFNAAPLFGNQAGYTGGSSTGNDGAQPVAVTSAMGPGGSAGSTSPASAATTGGLGQYLNYILIAAGILGAILLVKSAFFAKKK